MGEGCHEKWPAIGGSVRPVGRAIKRGKRKLFVSIFCFCHCRYERPRKMQLARKKRTTPQPRARLCDAFTVVSDSTDCSSYPPLCYFGCLAIHSHFRSGQVFDFLTDARTCALGSCGGSARLCWKNSTGRKSEGLTGKKDKYID